MALAVAAGSPLECWLLLLMPVVAGPGADAEEKATISPRYCAASYEVSFAICTLGCFMAWQWRHPRRPAGLPARPLVCLTARWATPYPTTCPPALCLNAARLPLDA